MKQSSFVPKIATFNKKFSEKLKELSIFGNSRTVESENHQEEKADFP